MVDQRHPAACQVLLSHQRGPETAGIPDRRLETLVGSHLRHRPSGLRLALMRWLRKLQLRFRSLFNRSGVERDLEDELRDYLDHEIERAIAAGCSPEEANSHAQSTLSGTERLKDEC